MSGLGEDDVGLVPYPAAPAGRQIAVVRRSHQPGNRQPVERAELVLCQSLGGIYQESGAARVFEDPLGDRDLVAEGLPGRGTGHQDHMGALPDLADRPGLVAVQPGDSLARQPLGQADRRAVGRGLRTGHHAPEVIGCVPVRHRRRGYVATAGRVDGSRFLPFLSFPPTRWRNLYNLSAFRSMKAPAGEASHGVLLRRSR